MIYFDVKFFLTIPCFFDRMGSSLTNKKDWEMKDFITILMLVGVATIVLLINKQSGVVLNRTLYDDVAKTLPIGEYIWIHKKLDKIMYLGRDKNAYYIKYNGDRLAFTLRTRKITLKNKSIRVLKINSNFLVIIVEPMLEAENP